MGDLRQIQEQAQAQGVQLHLVLKEWIHLLVLDHLSRKGAFSWLVFQGGTALRLAYQGLRYSEDLDFVLKKGGKIFFSRLPEYLKHLPSALAPYPIFGGPIRLKEQKGTPTFRRFTLTIPIEGLRISDRTNIEVAHVPSYENEPRILRHAEIPVSPAVQVESPREILSDKLAAFGARAYVKGRDLWDLNFLSQTLGVTVDERVRWMAMKKLSDYRLNRADFKARFDAHLRLLKDQGETLLAAEMDRFLPVPHRALFKKKYPALLKQVLGLLSGFRPALERG